MNKLFLIMLLCLPIVLAEVEVSYNDPNVPQVNIEYPVTTISSNGTVNNYYNYTGNFTFPIMLQTTNDEWIIRLNDSILVSTGLVFNISAGQIQYYANGILGAYIDAGGNSFEYNDVIAGQNTVGIKGVWVGNGTYQSPKISFIGTEDIGEIKYDEVESPSALAIINPLYINKNNNALYIKSHNINFENGDKISLFDKRFDDTAMYGFGVESNSLYSKSPSAYTWYINYAPLWSSPQTNYKMRLNNNGLEVLENVTANNFIGNSLNVSNITSGLLNLTSTTTPLTFPYNVRFGDLGGLWFGMYDSVGNIPFYYPYTDNGDGMYIGYGYINNNLYLGSDGSIYISPTNNVYGLVSITSQQGNFTKSTITTGTVTTLTSTTATITNSRIIRDNAITMNSTNANITQLTLRYSTIPSFNVNLNGTFLHNLTGLYYANQTGWGLFLPD